jgi:hypothetical protein
MHIFAVTLHDYTVAAVEAEYYIPSSVVVNFYIGEQCEQNMVASFYDVISVVRTIDTTPAEELTAQTQIQAQAQGFETAQFTRGIK